VQVVDLGLQRPLALLASQLEARQLLLVLLAQGTDAQTLLLDQLGSLQAMLLLFLLGLLVGLVARGIGCLPLVLGSHLQALGQHHRRVLLHQQAQGVALGGIAHQHQVVLAGRQARVPQVHLVPGHRALAAAGQADRACAQVRATPGIVGQVAQRQVPALVGGAVLVEIQVEEHHGAHQQARIDQYIGQAHLLIGELGHVHHVVEQRLEFGKQHFLADAAVIEEQHRFDHLRFVLHAHGFPSRPSGSRSAYYGSDRARA